ncbi:MAG: hemerythrin domain-containing protein [Spirochaetota bacterium]
MKTADPNFIGKSIPDMTNVQVMSYLITTHHEFTRNIMDEIGELIHEAGLELIDPPAELSELAAMWKRYHEEMVMHLHDEEKILFPWIEQLDQSGKTSEEITRAYSGSVKQMLEEHKHHEEDMEKVKVLADKLSQKGGYAPVLARLAYKLKQLNQDLQEHMEIESSLLFPRILGKIR